MTSAGKPHGAATARVSILRSAPGEPSRYQEFVVPFDPMGTVMDVLIGLRRREDPTLAFRCSCNAGLCAACLIRLNGKTVYACQERMGADMVIEPLDKYPLIRDLVVDIREARGAREEAAHGGRDEERDKR